MVPPDDLTVMTVETLTPQSTLEDFARAVDRWLIDNEASLSARWAESVTLDAQMEYLRELFAALWDSGCSRWGWPEEIGGFGGSPLFRAVLAEKLALAGLAPTFATMPEVLAVPFAAAASKELVATYLRPYLQGRDWWCQGFSEPEAGSDLASLTTRAEPSGTSFVINGQKIWTTLAHHAQRCLLLVRTGPRELAHKSLSLFLVDMTTPGITVRPITASTGEPEFCEVFFNDVHVPGDRLVGVLNGGWPIVMHVLACERSTVFWGRVAWMQHELSSLVSRVDVTETSAKLIGEAYRNIMSLRARSRRTQFATASGNFNPVESSIDKVLMATAEQSLFDVAAELTGDSVAFGTSPTDVRLRKNYLMSRVASVYGGTSEIQRNIIAQRLLGLPRSPG